VEEEFGKSNFDGFWPKKDIFEVNFEVCGFNDGGGGSWNGILSLGSVFLS